MLIRLSTVGRAFNNSILLYLDIQTRQLNSKVPSTNKTRHLSIAKTNNPKVTSVPNILCPRPRHNGFRFFSVCALPAFLILRCLKFRHSAVDGIKLVHRVSIESFRGCETGAENRLPALGWSPVGKGKERTHNAMASVPNKHPENILSLAIFKALSSQTVREKQSIFDRFLHRGAQTAQQRKLRILVGQNFQTKAPLP